MDYMGRSLILPTLAKLVPAGGVLEGHTFTNCHLRGPAVLFPMEDDMIIKNADYGVSIPWSWHPEKDGKYGSIGVVNCAFIDCRFEGVGFLLSLDEIAIWQEQVEVHPA
jgi:hypothetical protein